MPIESDKDLIASAALPKRTEIGLDTAREIKPYDDISYAETYESMSRFFENEWKSSEQSGFEIIYDGERGRTGMNILIDTESDNSGQTLNHFDDIEQANVENEEFELFQNLDTDSYVTGGRVYFEKDYWNPILDNPSDMDGDPLQPLISQISQNGRNDITTVVQVTSSPIDDKDWRKRYPLFHMLYRAIVGLLSVSYSVVAITVVPLIIYGINAIRDIANIFPFVNMRKKNVEMERRTTQRLREVFEEVQSTFEYLVGYTREQYEKEFESKIEDETKSMRDKINERNALEKLLMRPVMPKFKSFGATTSENLQNQLSEALGRVDEKGKRHGSVVEMRVLAFGGDEEELEIHMDRLEDEIETLYTTSDDDASVQQSLEVNRVQRRNDMKQLLMDIGQRKTGVDYYGRVRNHYKVKNLHKNRTRPMVMTPPEMANIIHIPSTDVSDRSVGYDQKKPTGNVPDKYE